MAAWLRSWNLVELALAVTLALLVGAVLVITLAVSFVSLAVVGEMAGWHGRVAWALPEAALDEFSAQRIFLLPPTWTQLDSLTGRTVAEVLSVDRQIAAVQPTLTVAGGNWEIEFFDSARYNAARAGRAP